MRRELVSKALSGNSLSRPLELKKISLKFEALIEFDLWLIVVDWLMTRVGVHSSLSDRRDGGRRRGEQVVDELVHLFITQMKFDSPQPPFFFSRLVRFLQYLTMGLNNR